MKKRNQKKLNGLAAFDAAKKCPSPHDPIKSIKELYAGSMQSSVEAKVGDGVLLSHTAFVKEWSTVQDDDAWKYLQ